MGGRIAPESVAAFDQITQADRPDRQNDRKKDRRASCLPQRDDRCASGVGGVSRAADSRQEGRTGENFCLVPEAALSSRDKDLDTRCLLDHLIGTRKKVLRDIQTKRPSGLHVD
jgi:hypothetical protein